MPFFGVPIRNGLPIGLGSVAGFGVQQFDPSLLFEGGTVSGAWYDPSDLTTMFDTSAGTTPVAMPGQGSAVPVGLMLDKSQGLVLGSELVTNGTFDTNTTGWSSISSATISWNSDDGGSALVDVTGSGGGITDSQTISVVSGKTYLVTARIRLGTFSGNLNWDLDGSSNIVITPTAVYQTFTRRYQAVDTDLNITITRSTPATGTFYVSDISVRELTGNHAISFNNTTARPELRARVNLLTYSEEFDNGAWSKTNATVTANTVVAPDGTLTADSLVEDATTNNHVVQLGSLGLASGTYVASMYVRPKDGRNYCLFYIVGFNGGQYFDLTGNGSVLGTQGASPTAPSITPVANGFYRIQFTFNGTATNFQIYTSDNGTRFSGFAGNGSTGLFVWGADLRPANIGANVPAYQRIADANTYDTSGFPLYLLFEGAVGQRGMYTPANLNLSGTDKVAVFAGVRKLSDAAAGLIIETSSNINSNSGAMFVIAPTSAAPDFAFTSRGTAIVPAIALGYAAPLTSVLTGLGDISGDQAILRVNGTQAAINTSDQGTGNYGTYPLFIGSRNNASVWLNGHLYSLVVAGSAVSAGNISATEQWVAGKTGIQI